MHEHKAGGNDAFMDLHITLYKPSQSNLLMITIFSCKTGVNLRLLIH